MGLLSHRVEKSEISAGDHVYSWRAVFAYSHHGIYVGGKKVVHFTCEQNIGSSGDSSFSSSGPAPSSGSSLNLSASSSKVPSTCPNFPDCGFRQPKSGVVLSCLDCFLGNGSLYRFEYGVTSSVFLAKLRGGTCTTAESDPPDAVIHRAMFLLQNGFGNYDVFKNNCEDFALYCKTGFLIRDEAGLGRSGQAACVIGAPLAALLSSPLKLFMPSPVAVVTATAGMYCMSRYATDIGVRTDVVKVKVEDMALFHGCGGPNEELAKDDECCEGELMHNMTNTPASKQHCMSRYVTDVGVRTDVVKVKVEDMTLFHGCGGPNEELAKVDECCEGEFMNNMTDTPASKQHFLSRYTTDFGVRTDVVKVKVENMALFHGCGRPNEELAKEDECCEGELMHNMMDTPASKRQKSC